MSLWSRIVNNCADWRIAYRSSDRLCPGYFLSTDKAKKVCHRSMIANPVFSINHFVISDDKFSVTKDADSLSIIMCKQNSSDWKRPAVTTLLLRWMPSREIIRKIRQSSPY